MSFLAEQEIDDLIDCLRRNLLYQTPEIIIGETDETHPKAVICRMRPDDYFLIFELLKKAGGWDLTDEQKETMRCRSLDEISQAIALGNVGLDALDSGTLLWIIEKTEFDPTYKLLREVAEQELLARSEAH